MKLCKPLRSAKQSVFIVVSSIILYAASVAATLLLPSFTAGFRVVGALFLFVGFMLLCRYTFSEYVYCLSEDGFAVRRTFGSKTNVIFSVELEEIEKLCLSADLKKLSSGAKKISFRQNLSPALNAFLLCKKGKKLYSIEIEPNDVFLNLLAEAIDKK